MPSSLSAQTRFYRKLHKWLSLPLLFFMVLVSVTGILLAWKKPLALLPPTQRTQVERPEQMLPVEELMRIGVQYVQDSVGLNPLLDRVDIRPEKGIAKIVFKRHFKEVQLDAYSGQILSVKQRNSDVIESLHDGSILDFLFEADGGYAKMGLSTLMGLGLLLLSVSGFYLWWNPKRIKQLKAK